MRLNLFFEDAIRNSPLCFHVQCTLFAVTWITAVSRLAAKQKFCLSPGMFYGFVKTGAFYPYGLNFFCGDMKKKFSQNLLTVAGVKMT